jgi:hypothetical protein
MDAAKEKLANPSAKEIKARVFMFGYGDTVGPENKL